MEAALLVLRTARQAQHELHRVRWAAETTSGGVLVLASHPVSSGWPKLSHEPGTVLPLGETQLRWSTKACARSLTVVVAAQRPPGTRAGAVALEPGTAWWAPLRQKDDLVVVLSRYGAEALAAQAALEACVERWARATLGEASVPGALSAARRLAAVYAAPSRPARPFTWAVGSQAWLAAAPRREGPRWVIDQLGLVGPLGRLLGPLRCQSQAMAATACGSRTSLGVAGRATSQGPLCADVGRRRAAYGPMVRPGGQAGPGSQPGRGRGLGGRGS